MERFLETSFGALAAKASLAVHSPEQSFLKAQGHTGEVLVEKVIRRLLHTAYLQRASDMHIEPGEDVLQIRYRVDGILQKGPTLDPLWQGPLLARLKLMAKVPLQSQFEPSEGQFSFLIGARSIYCRLSCLPISGGQTAVLRLIEPDRPLLGMEELGFLLESRLALESLIQKPSGLIIIAGPTGAGKTTTLYACLSKLAKQNLKIITIEDPVETVLQGISQVNIAASPDLTFASALRAILRQSPNVIMIGEVRDAQTAELATHAALTGHLVFACVHAADSPLAVGRFLHFGIPAPTLSTALSGVVAQRLARRTCPFCTPQKDFSIDAVCLHCHSTGFHGRMGIFEILSNTPAVSRCILSAASINGLREQLLAEGMKSLSYDSKIKIDNGWIEAADI